MASANFFGMRVWKGLAALLTVARGNAGATGSDNFLVWLTVSSSARASHPGAASLG